MKKILLLLTLILGFTFCYSQNDCSQGDGTFRYEAKLYIVNVPSEFDKNDFINHIISLDNISNEDLAILNEHITLVYKTFPSQNPHTTVTIVTTLDVFSILDDLNNSIEFHYCVVNDCSWSDGTFRYYALLTSTDVPNDFDKDDFIDFIIGIDIISNEDLTILETHITSVEKAFPSSQSDLLKRVVDVEATLEIYSILTDLNNAIEHNSCNSEAILEINDYNKHKNSIIYPNPVTEHSILEINSNSNNIKIDLINSLGQIIHSERVSKKTIIELRNFPKVIGVSFLNIQDLTNGTLEILKIIREE
ncbi:T9SS type A sorting domain-containing protein [Rasiella rasia]|uniref:T9SS type A sorting domain-containing protein n=1 Tax=Rasiella rasia TaxID=2744027 RepID=A0A6G6GJK2_9FLAO|nr:T9SS type A sorting domain-containing protein [Rasiella rasia]QIE58694.1 T9SS type A sorting domain-containing protein [Rasiella rasia]